DVDEDDHVAEVVRDVGEGVDDGVLRQAVDHAVLVRVPVRHRRLELVVEEVVAGLVDRGHLRRALGAAAAVDVDVREDPEQPGPEVRAGLVLPPGAERTGVRLLHQVLRLLAGADQSAGNAVDLVTELQRLLFEANAVARVLRNPARIWGGRRAVAHLTATLATVSNASGPISIPVFQSIPIGVSAGRAKREVEWKATTASRATTTRSGRSSTRSTTA